MEVIRVMVGPHRQIIAVQKDDERKRIELTDEQAEQVKEFALNLLTEEQLEAE